MLEYNRSIAVILPAYNEELTIAGTLRAFHAVMPDAFFYVVEITQQMPLRTLLKKHWQTLAPKVVFSMRQDREKGMP